MKDLRLVEFAAALGRHRSFARAAESVHVTQPTFSRGIAALEKDLGVRLFDRTTRSVEPTPEGLTFLRHAGSLLEDARRLRSSLSDETNLRSGQLVIGVGPHPLGISVLESVARLTTSYPKLHIQVVEGDWRAFGSKLLQREVDVAVVETSVVATDPRFQVEPLPAHSGCFFVRRGHPLSGRSGLTLREVLEFPFVATTIGGRLLRQFPSGAPGLLVEPSTGDLMPRITISSVEAMRQIVTRTDCVGMCVPTQIADDLRRARLVVLDVDFELPRTGYGVVWLRDRSLSAAAQAFVNVIREVENALDDPAVPAAHARRRRTKVAGRKG